jgi:hypothetical protein
MNEKDLEKTIRLVPDTNTEKPEDRKRFAEVRQAVKDILKVATEKRIDDDTMISATESILGFYLAFSGIPIERVREILNLSADRVVEMVITIRNEKQ